MRLIGFVFSHIFFSNLFFCDSQIIFVQCFDVGLFFCVLFIIFSILIISDLCIVLKTRVFEVKSLMDEITTLFKNLKDHAGSKTASKKASKAAKGASKRFQRMTQKELILAYEHAIDAAETKLRLPLSLIGVDYRTVIPEALDKRFDNPDYKRRLQALHDRHVQWMAIIEDRTAPWGA